MLTRFRLDFQTSEGGKRRYQHTIDDIIPNKKIQTEEEATENQSEKSISPEKTDLIGMNPNQSSNQTLPASSFPSTMPSLNDQMSRIREAFYYHDCRQLQIQIIFYYKLSYKNMHKHKQHNARYSS